MVDVLALASYGKGPGVSGARNMSAAGVSNGSAGGYAIGTRCPTSCPSGSRLRASASAAVMGSVCDTAQGPVPFYGLLTQVWVPITLTLS